MTSPKKESSGTGAFQVLTPCRIAGAGVLGLFIIGSMAATGLMWFTDIYVDSILNAMTLREDSDVFEAWRKPPVKPLICFHVFNYTNVDKHYAGQGEKLKLQQAGPYCYRESLEKKNVTFNDDGTITYGDTRKHEFEPEHSNGTEQDILIVPNLGLISVISMIRDNNFLVQQTLSSVLSTLNYTHSTIRVTAKELFFGYEDRLVDVVSSLASVLPLNIPAVKTGLLSKRGAETDETITVATGTDDLERIGMVTAVDGEAALHAWPAPECNRIDGSDGAFFPRHGVNESATIYLFHRDLCRRMPFKYDKEVDFQDGIMAMRFKAAPDVYNTNGTCYCRDEDNCPPIGVFDLSPCAMDAPVMMSFPHFLYGEESLFEMFEGLQPDENAHQFYIDVQRVLGFTLGTVSRLQFNIRVYRTFYMSILEEFQDETILPVAWIQVSAERLPPDLFNLIYHATFTVQRIQLGLKWGLLVTSVCLMAGLFWTCRPAFRQPDKDKETAQPMLPKQPITLMILPSAAPPALRAQLLHHPPTQSTSHGPAYPPLPD